MKGFYFNLLGGVSLLSAVALSSSLKSVYPDNREDTSITTISVQQQVEHVQERPVLSFNFMPPAVLIQIAQELDDPNFLILRHVETGLIEKAVKGGYSPKLSLKIEGDWASTPGFIKAFRDKFQTLLNVDGWWATCKISQTSPLVYTLFQIERVTQEYQLDLTLKNILALKLNPKGDHSENHLAFANLRESALFAANLTGADLRGADLRGADLSSAYLMDADLTNANLNCAFLCFTDLSKATLINLDLSQANMRSANLVGANLSIADLQDADLTDANLSEASLESANLSEATLRNAEMVKVGMRGAKLFKTDLTNARLSCADMRGTFLIKANLFKANLWKANLFRANLKDANLSEANLTGADLRGADLRGAIMTAEQKADYAARGAIVD